MDLIQPNNFKNAVRALLDETFDQVRGFYLDGGTSLFETLAGIRAAEASIPVGGKCASLAAQVRHTAFYLHHTVDFLTSDSPEPADWGLIWRTVQAVDEAEWAAFQADLRMAYDRILALIEATPAWGEAEIAGTIAVVAHTAYHLGEIRQALCTLKDSKGSGF